MTSNSGLDFGELYKSFNAPVCDFDCGQLCAPLNNGVPACCKGDEVIPVLYVGEFRRLLERTNLWEAFQPKTAHDRKLVDDHEGHQLAVCRGVAHCERDNRSLNCRTFPFSPYLDHDGRVGGLVYDLEAAEGKCPLVDLPQTVTRRYIREARAFWTALLVESAEDRRFHTEESVRLRRQCGGRREAVMVLVESGMAEYPTSESEWRLLGQDESSLKLIQWDRPEG